MIAWFLSWWPWSLVVLSVGGLVAGMGIRFALYRISGR